MGRLMGFAPGLSRCRATDVWTSLATCSPACRSWPWRYRSASPVVFQKCCCGKPEALRSILFFHTINNTFGTPPIFSQPLRRDLPEQRPAIAVSSTGRSKEIFRDSGFLLYFFYGKRINSVGNESRRSPVRWCVAALWSGAIGSKDSSSRAGWTSDLQGRQDSKPWLKPSILSSRF